MTLRLTRLDASLPIAGTDGSPSSQFLRLYNGAMDALERQETNQDAILEAIQQAQDDLAAQLAQILAVTARDKRTASYTVPTAVLTASDTGSAARIAVAGHARIYSDATPVAITGDNLDALAYSTAYAVYYDDTTLADTTPTFVATTDIEAAQVGAADGRHFLGVITTPAAAGPPVTGGGTYAPGSSIGGEIP